MQHMLLIPFVGLILLSVSVVGMVSMHNGNQAVDRAVNRLKTETGTRITDHLTRFLTLPHQINQTNAAALGGGLVDPGDQAALARYFRDQVLIFDSVTSINFSNRDGGLVNAGREGQGDDLYEIVTDDFKSGPFRKYALDGRGRRAGVISTLQYFDGRTRPWYIDAVEKGRPVWSDPYVLFTGQDLSINAALPVVDAHNRLLGVVAVDLFLSHLSEFLSRLNADPGARSVVLERSGLMIATSSGEKPFTRSPGTADYRRKGLEHSIDPVARAAAAALRDTFGGYHQIRDQALFEFDLEDERQLGNVIPYKGPHGLDWLVVTIIPEQAFMAHVPGTHRATFGVILVTLLAAAGIGVLICRIITRPVSELDIAAGELSRGKWDQRIRRPARIREISDLTDAFNQMAGQLEQMVTGLNREISERRKAEKKYQTLVENLTEIVYTLDTQANITYVSPSIKELSGYDPREVVGRNFIEFVHPEDIDGRLEQYHKVMSGVIESSEYRFLDKAGNPVWIKTCARPVMENGSITGIHGVLTDITKLKAAEARIRQLEKAESLDRMAAAVAHHYNNQLTAVMGNLELAQMQAEEAEQADLARVLNNAMASARRAARMGDAMLGLLGNKTERRQRLDLVAICREFLAEFQSRMPENISLQVCLPGSGLEVMANAGQIKDLLDNLVQNAREAMGEKTGRIEVDMAAADPADIPQTPRWPLTFTPEAARYVRVSVKDQGDGIPADQVEKIFDPFFSTRFIGRGLGLSICLSIVKSHNGCIILETASGKGSLFHVFLPEAT